MKAKRTLGPWNVEVQPDELCRVFGYARNLASTPITVALDVRQANAEYIVRACNAHEDLVKVVKLSLVYMPVDLLDEVQTALAKAEGKDT